MRAGSLGRAVLARDLDAVEHILSLVVRPKHIVASFHHAMDANSRDLLRLLLSYDPQSPLAEAVDITEVLVRAIHEPDYWLVEQLIVLLHTAALTYVTYVTYVTYL